MSNIFVNLISEFNAKGFKDAQKQTSALDKSLKRLAVTLGTALSARRIAQFGKASVLAASNLEEAMSKVNVVFARGAAEVEAFGRSSAASLGISSSAALEAAGTYGNLLQAFGIGQRQAQGMSMALVKLAADMASFNNTSIDQAITALRSGLSGETEPLKRYGVALQDVRLRTEALRMGLIRNTREALTPAVKAQAAYALIMKDTALAQGDFERTAGGVANSLKIIAASADNAQAIIGEKLIRSMDLLVDREEGVSKVAVAFESMATNIGNAAVGLATIGRVVTTLGGLLPGSGASILDFKANIPGLIGFQQLVKLGQKDTAQQAAKKAAIDRANAKEQGMLASRNLGTQRKTTKELSTQVKLKKESNKLDKASQTFDDELISLEAALKNAELSENEVLRLKLKKALVLENADQAEKLAKKLQESQAELLKLAAFKPEDPFADWLTSLDELNKRIAALSGVTAPTMAQGEVARQVISLGESTGNTEILDTGVKLLSQWLTAGEDAALKAVLESERAGIEADISGAKAQQMATNININVTGTGDLSDETKKKIVDTIIDYSSIGYSTSGWYRTTGNVAV